MHFIGYCTENQYHSDCMGVFLPHDTVELGWCCHSRLCCCLCYKLHISEYQFKFQLLCTVAEEAGGRWPEGLHPCCPHGRPGWSSILLTLA